MKLGKRDLLKLWGATLVSTAAKGTAKAQSAEPDEGDTAAFTALAQAYPLINLLRQSVVRTRINPDPAEDYRGNGVNLDGRIMVCTAHQVHGQNQMQISFPHMSDLQTVRTTASFIAQDPVTDLSFWSFDEPDIIANSGMLPIEWGQMWDGRRTTKDSILSLGYVPTLGGGLCDARLHKIVGYLPEVNIYNDQYVMQPHLCKFNLGKSIVRSESGSGGFDLFTGQFLGIFNSTSDVDCQLTPAEAIREAYTQIQSYAQPQRGGATLPFPSECIPTLTTALVP